MLCKACNSDHPISYFRKNGKDRKGKSRYYAECKYCQMGIEPPALKSQTTKAVDEFKTPTKQKLARVIESEKSNDSAKVTEATKEERQPSRLIEPETSTQKTQRNVIEWVPWEIDYRDKLGIELNEADKLEIKSTVPAYFDLLSKIDRRLKAR